MIEQLNLDATELFETIIQMANSGIYWKDADGKYLGCNHLFLQMLGFKSQGEIIGKKDCQLWDFSEKESLLVAKHDQVAFQRGYLESNECRVVAGKTKMFFFKRTRMVNKRGEVVGILGTCMAISETAIDSRYCETLLQQIIDTVNASIYWKDRSGRYLGCNQYVVSMAGLQSREQIIGKSDAELVWANAYEELLAVDMGVINNGRFVGEEKFPTAHEVERVFLTVKDQLIGTNGEVYGLIGTSIEISAQKAAEKLRLSVVSQQILIDESEKFKKAAHQVGHDIRSPLSTILMTLKVSEDMPEPQRVALRNAATRINDIANNLISRFMQEQKNKMINEEPREATLVSSAMLEILTEKKYQYLNSPLTLTHDFSATGNFSWINIKPSALKRMISNLINNAVDAFDGRVGQVTVRLEATEQEVLITIKDNGKGMSPALVQKLRNKIPITAEKFGGHGIGMTQVHDTLDENEGCMEIDTALGLGAQIRLRFPRVGAQHWIADHIALYDDDTLVILDDDDSIHAAWDFRFGPLCQRYPQFKILHHNLGQETLDFFGQLTSEQKHKVFLLSDFELLHQAMTGLDVIAQIGEVRSVLVTSYYGNRDIQQSAEKTGTQILPKQLAADVPIQIARRLPGEAGTDAGVVDTQTVDAVFVEDDQNLLKAYGFFVADKYRIDTYFDPKVFLDQLARYPKQTKVFLDQNLSNFDKKGAVLAEQLHAMGYDQLYLLTGEHGLTDKTPDYLTVLTKGDMDVLSAALSRAC